jgi:hypothetical protein
VPRPKTPLPDRIAQLTRREGECLSWTGVLNNGVPHMKGIGNPRRVLYTEHFGTELHPKAHLGPACGTRLCIRPEHQAIRRHNKHQLIQTQAAAPPPPPEPDEEDIIEELIGCIHATDDWDKMSFEELCADNPDFTPDQVRAALAKIREEK